jgi:hypothetical protein
MTRNMVRNEYDSGHSLKKDYSVFFLPATILGN